MPIQQFERTQDAESGQEKLEAKEKMNLPPWHDSTNFTTIGRSYPRIEGAQKVTGQARYAYDMRLPGQLYARLLRSPHPHARIRAIDVSEAERLPGVYAILCSNNASDIPWYQDDKSKLFDRTLRFVGDEVAAVAAESEEIADDALHLIRVDYEPLPFVLELEQALQADAPVVHKKGNQVDEPKIYSRGDTNAALQQAEVIIDQIYTTQTALHNALEPHGCTATWEGEQLILWESTQGIFKVRKQVAEKLGLPQHHVRIIKQFMGGGFGAKQVAWKHAVIAALLAKQANRPVQLMLDRQAENLAAGNRSATWQHVRLAAKKDGTLTAIDVDIKIAIGAYMVGGEATNVSGMYQRLYRCANVRTQQVGIYTHSGPAVSFRAPGHVEAAFALEAAMDELARALQMDPLALRLKNYAEEDQKEGQPYTTPESLRLCYEHATTAFGWLSYQRPSSHATKRRGIGFAAHDWGGSGKKPGYAWVKLNSDGTVDVVTATQDIGTGTRTGLSQVAAEELGIPIDQITLHLGDTAQGPYSPTSAGSTTQASVGPAVRAAAAEAKAQLLQAAAKLLEEEAERLCIRNGLIEVENAPENRVTVAEVTGRLAPHMIIGQGAAGAPPKDQSARTFGAQCVEVEVDVETGEITVLRIAASHDCGRIINPTLVESQVIGAITQGVGFALLEERITDRQSGLPLNANLEEYKIPTMADIPTILHAPINLPDLAANPTGAKGIGEPPLIPTAPAIANAVFDAVGVRLRHAPLSRRALLDALSGRPHPHA